MIPSCNDYATLTANTPDVDEVGTWKVISGDGKIENSDLHNPNAKITNLSAGGNLIEWRITRGEGENACPSADEVTVKSFKITMSVTSSAEEYCSDEGYVIGSVNLSKEDYTSEWTSIGSDAEFVDPSATETTVKKLSEGKNTLVWTVTVDVDGQHCESSAQVEVTNNTAPQALLPKVLPICDVETEVKGNMPPQGTTGKWDCIQGNADFDDETSEKTIARNLVEGDNYLTWTITKGKCTSVATMIVKASTVTTKTSGTDGGDVLYICGTETPISAAPAGAGGSGWWTTTSEDAKFVDDITGSETVNITNVTPGEHHFVWHVKEVNGCEASAPLTVVNDKYPAKASMADKNPICNGQALLMGNMPPNGGTGYWSGPDNAEFSNKEKPVTTMKFTNIGPNQAIWHIQKRECISTASVDIYNLTVRADVGSNEIIVCSEDEVKNINASAPPEGGSGEWDIINGTGSIADKTSYSTTITEVGQGSNTLKWKVTSKEWQGETCSAETTLVVSNNYFTTNAGADFSVCGYETELKADYQGAKAQGHWSGGHFENASSYKTKVSGLKASSRNTFRWTVTLNGCTAYDDVVVYCDKVEITITSGEKVTCSPRTNVEARQSAGTGTWTIPTGYGKFDNSTANSTMVDSLSPNDNVIRWTVEYGETKCQSFEEAVIHNKTVYVSAGYDYSTCDTFAVLAGQPPLENQEGMWYWGTSRSDIGTLDSDIIYPTIEDPTRYNSRVSGLYYDDDGQGYSNAFTWYLKDNETGCDGEATVRIRSYHFKVDADAETVDNYKVTDSPSIELTAKDTPYYTGYWESAVGNGKPTPKEGFTTKVTNLSQGNNKIKFTGKLIGSVNGEADNNIPPCTASNYVTVAYRAFTVNAGEDKSICEDHIQLNAERVLDAECWWSAAENGSAEFSKLDDPKATAIKLSPGPNTLIWNVRKNGYLAQDFVTIYNYGFKVDAGEDQHLCEPFTTIKGTGPLDNPLLTDESKWTGSWDTRKGGVVYENRSVAATDITELKAMTNVLVWRVTMNENNLQTSDRPSIACSAEDSVKITYYTAPEPEFSIVPAVAAGCTPFDAEFVNLTNNTDNENPVTYRWNFGNKMLYESTDPLEHIQRTFENDQNYDSIVPVKLTTCLKIPSSETCYAEKTMNVTVFPVPKANFTVSPELQMQPSMNVNYYADKIPGDPMIYSWNFDDGIGPVWNNNNEFESSPVHTYAKYGTYKISLKVQNGHCWSSDTHQITILPAPPAQTLRAAGYAGCEPYLHELLEGVIYDDSVRWDIYSADDMVLRAQRMVKAGASASYLFNKPGRYLLYQYAYGPGTETEKYMRTDTVTVHLTPTVSFEAHPDTVRLPNIPLFTENTSTNAVEWLWDFGDGGTSGEMEPTYYYTKSGDFYVTLTGKSEFGCQGVSPEVHVRVEPEGKLVFPNAFVPDVSGPSGGIPDKQHNYVFLPYPRNGVKAGTYILEIFNRYGEKIFESNDPDIGWDGYYRGSLCKQDVYVFKCRCTFENGKIFKQVGNVTLLR
jgi:PKD repeat protein